MMCFPFILLILIIYSEISQAAAPVNSIPLKIINHAGSPVEVFWIDTFKNDGTLVKQSAKPLRNSSESSINSYESHQFLVRFLNHVEGLEARFEKGPKEETLIIGFDGTQFQLKQFTKVGEIMEMIEKATSQCDGLINESFASCITDEVREEISIMTKAKSDILKFRDLMSSRLSRYICEDGTLDPPSPTSAYVLPIHGKPHQVKVLFDTEHAKIWTVDNFISDEDCALIQEFGEPKLVETDVTDGASTVSSSTGFGHLTYKMDEENTKMDPLWNVVDSARLLINYQAEYSLVTEFQEDLEMTQYGTGDSYSAHCDSACDDSYHIPGGRVASVKAFCQAPDAGGKITFSNADVFVQPKKNMAIFFTYTGRDGRMDEGYTRHSSCPITEGKSSEVSLWFRDGVTPEKPARYFLPDGTPKHEALMQ